VFLRFVICLVDDRRIHFKGRAKLEMKENLSEIDIEKNRNELISAGRKVVSRHIKGREEEVSFTREIFELEDCLVFVYRARGKEYQVIFKRTGPLGYFFAKFFPLFY